MSIKLRVEVSVVVDEKGDMELGTLRELVKQYLKQGKFMVNTITMKQEFEEVNKNE